MTYVPGSQPVSREVLFKPQRLMKFVALATMVLPALIFAHNAKAV